MSNNIKCPIRGRFCPLPESTPLGAVLAAELADWRFDDTRFPGNALALLVGDPPVWQEDGERDSLAARLASVDRAPWKLHAEDLAMDPETEICR